MLSVDVAVIGASGKTGRAVTASLRARRLSTRTLGRTELADPVEALRGCESVYLIAPNLHADESALVARILAAAVEAGVSRIVYHSVVSPRTESMPHHLGKAAGEDLVRRSSMVWTIVRPSCYLQNFLPALSGADPALRVPYDTTKQFTFVDLFDVAEAAAQIIEAGTHGEATYELGGSERTSIDDLARAAGDVLGTHVPAERLDPAAWSRTQGAALGPRERAWLLAMFDHYDHHGLLCPSAPLEELLGRPPTAVGAALRRDLRV